MSTLKTNNVQVGQSVTATNNFTLYQPSTPDGTVRIGVGNSGATTSDAVVIGSSGITKGVISSGTAVTASGTSVDFTGIPSTAKRITILLDGVSLSGSALLIARIGTGGVLETSGYSAVTTSVTTTNNTTRGVTTSTYFQLQYSNSAPFTQIGTLVLNKLNGNTWIANGSFYNVGGVAGDYVSGSKTLAGTLDRVSITTSNGTDTFDAGTINILYEG